MKKALELLKHIGAFLLRPFFLYWKRRYPQQFKSLNQTAAPLDLSGMLSQFGWLHRLLFRNLLKRIRISEKDLEKIRQASSQGKVLYMMRNWGQIEYNFFNLIFLNHHLPLATHANGTRMVRWMSWKTWVSKVIGRLNHFYEHKKLYHEPLYNGQNTPFLFLNLSPYLEKTQNEEQTILFPLLETVAITPSDTPHFLIPLHFSYDWKPTRLRHSLRELFFGEINLPGKIRKFILFFRHCWKRGIAAVGDPIRLESYCPDTPSENQLSLAANRLKTDLSNLFFEESQRLRGPRLKSRARMIEEILNTPHFNRGLLNIAHETQQNYSKLLREAKKILKNTVADPNYQWIEGWRILLRWAFKHLYQSLEYPTTSLDPLKKLAGKVPLILVPCHKSHVDYLLLSYIFYENHLAIPLIAAGNNLAFWPMRTIFRKSGAYFIRRRFGQDRLYSFVFKSYLDLLIQEGFIQEFFIEGTRSRSGSLNPAKTGLISLFLECFFKGEYPDLYWVPVGISYDRVLDEKSLLDEAAGSPKRKEGLRSLFKLPKYLKKKYGKARVQFGQPLSTRQFLESHGFSNARQAIDLKILSQTLANSLIEQIKEQLPLTPTHLISAALLTEPNRGQNLSVLKERIKLFQDTFKKLCAHTDLTTDFTELEFQQTLQSFTQEGSVIQSFDGLESFYVITDKGRLFLDYYKNGLASHLKPLSWLSLILLKANPTISTEHIIHHFDDLHAHLNPHHPPTHLNFITYLNNLEQIGGIEKTDLKDTWTIRSPFILETLGSLALAELESYWITGEFLQRYPQPLDTTTTPIKSLVEFANRLLLKGEVQRKEALSRYYLEPALKGLSSSSLRSDRRSDLWSFLRPRT